MNKRYKDNGIKLWIVVMDCFLNCFDHVIILNMNCKIATCKEKQNETFDSFVVDFSQFPYSVD